MQTDKKTTPRTVCLTLSEIYEMADKAVGDVDEAAAQLGRWMYANENDHEISDQEKQAVSMAYGAMLMFIERWKTVGDGLEKVAG